MIDSTQNHSWMFFDHNLMLWRLERFHRLTSVRSRQANDQKHQNRKHPPTVMQTKLNSDLVHLASRSILSVPKTSRSNKKSFSTLTSPSQKWKRIRIFRGTRRRKSHRRMIRLSKSNARSSSLSRRKSTLWLANLTDPNRPKSTLDWMNLAPMLRLFWRRRGQKQTLSPQGNPSQVGSRKTRQTTRSPTTARASGPWSRETRRSQYARTRNN